MRYLLVGLLSLILVPIAQANPFNGAVLISCNLASQAQVDPIVSFGVPSAHLHAFWGSDQASATTTLPQMLMGLTSCDLKSDKSLYWTPAGIAADGSMVFPTRSSFYYRAQNRGVPIHPFPSGLRFVWGNPNNLSIQNAVATWTCNGHSGRSIPTDCGGGGVQESIYVAPCWDGLDLGIGGGGHDSQPGNMAAAPGNPPQCPIDHPVNVPALQYIINWPPAMVGGRLTSDQMGATPGASAHVDFFNGWTFNSQGKDALSLLVNECLNVDGTNNTVTCRPVGGKILRNDGSYVTD